jgi:hypothetical protein
MLLCDLFARKSVGMNIVEFASAINCEQSIYIDAEKGIKALDNSFATKILDILLNSLTQ